MTNDTPSAILRDVAHRPWPLPATPWVMVQSWRDLLFAHWPVPADRLRALVPAPLELDVFEGDAWVTIAPFRVAGLRLRGLPPFLGTSDFPELNLRTYVHVGGRAGVWFLSLDAASGLAVAGARTLYRLPYHHAEMRLAQASGWVDYSSRRLRGEATFEARYRPAGEAAQPVPGTLDHFLTERYALYTVLRSGRVLRAQIHHSPWNVQPAEALIGRDTVSAAAGIEFPDVAPRLQYCARQDTLFWLPEMLDSAI
ncbi:MAG: YqjF family protein [Longimicrobiales bacterium]